MRIINLKILLKSLFALMLVSVILVSCSKTESEVEDATKLNLLAEDDYNDQKLMTIENLHDIVVANEGNIESRNCVDLYPGGLPCPEHVREAQLRVHCYYLVYFSDPTDVNRINMETAYCDYLLAFNYCYGTSYPC